MKYDSVMSLTNLKGKFERSNEEERVAYKEVKVHVTEKIDGENWRLGLVEGKKVIGSRKHLFYWDEIAEEFIHDHTHRPHPNWTKLNDETKIEVFKILDGLERTGIIDILFYGELYGNGLQKKFKFEHEGYAVIYYEISVLGVYIDQLEAFEWFDRFDLKKVPYIGEMTLEEFLDIDVESMTSQVATNPFIEGVVGVPLSGRYHWDFADRFIVKKKTKQFAETKSKKGPKKVKRKSKYAIHVTEERLNHVLAELKEDGHLFSHEKDFRFLVVEKMISNIQDEENEGKEFSKEDRKSLATEAHKLFSQCATL